MKKIGLLLLPALLITTACKTTSTSVTSSGGDVSSTSDSSSVEPIRFATPQEALRFLKEESYTFNIKSDYYGDDTEGKESNRLRLRREGLIVEGSELVEDDEGTHFEPVCYLDSTNEDAEQSYYLENGFWLRKDGVSKQVDQFLDHLTVAENMLGDVVEPEIVEWSYDEEKGIYHGDTTTSDTHAEFFIQMSPVFFDEIKIFTTSVAGSFHADVTITVKDAGSTVVELPETPVIDICNKIDALVTNYRQLPNFTLETLEYLALNGVPKMNDSIKFEIMTDHQETDSGHVDSYEIKRTFKDEVLYIDGTFINGQFSSAYIYDSEDEKWDEVTSEVFEGYTDEIFFFEDFSIMTPEFLAGVLYEIKEVGNTRIKFVISNPDADIQNYHPEATLEFSNNDIVTLYNLFFDGTVIVDGTEYDYSINQNFSVTKVGETSFDHPTHN